MKYKIVELDEFTGNEATIYSIIINNDTETLFDKFVKENYLLRDVSEKVTSRIREGRVNFISDGYELEGELEFEDEKDV